MRKKLLIGILCLIIVDGILAIRQHYYNYENDFPIDQKARNFLAFYKPNTSWVFENSNGKRDTILVHIDSVFYPPQAGFLAHEPYKFIEIHFTESSKYKLQYYKDDCILDGMTIRIEKYKYSKEISFSCFRGISTLNASDTLTKADSLKLDSVLFAKYLDIFAQPEPANYYTTEYTGTMKVIVKNPNPNYHPLDIADIYWVNKYGVLAYKLQNGDFWKRTNLN